MNVQRDPDAILAAWLHEGPTRLPDATRRAIAVSTRTTRQTWLPRWLPWSAPTLDGMTRSALAAMAVVAVVVGGIYLLRPGTDQPGGVGGPGSPVSSASPLPSASPVSSALPTPSPPPSAEQSIGALTQSFTSPTFGYSIRHPAGWAVTPTTGEGPTPDGQIPSSPRPRAGIFRATSLAIPDGVVVDDWILADASAIWRSVAACLDATPRNRSRRRARRPAPRAFAGPARPSDRGDGRRRQPRLSLHLVRFAGGA